MIQELFLFVPAALGRACDTGLDILGPGDSPARVHMDGSGNVVSGDRARQ